MLKNNLKSIVTMVSFCMALLVAGSLQASPLSSTGRVGGGTRVLADVDSDGLPDVYDLCPMDSTAWFLIPEAWVGHDENDLEDAESGEWIRTTFDGESAGDVSDGISISLGNTASADDLGEVLSEITFLYLFFGGSDYVYDEISDVNSWSSRTKNRADNIGDGFTYLGSLRDVYNYDAQTETLMEIMNNLSGDSSSYEIETETDFAGIIQMNCAGN